MQQMRAAIGPGAGHMDALFQMGSPFMGPGMPVMGGDMGMTGGGQMPDGSRPGQQPAGVLTEEGGRVFGRLAVWFEEYGGFGFIESRAAKEDILLHLNEVWNGRKEDMRVGINLTFTLEPDPRGNRYKAVDAMIIHR